ncbi:hypothetical protein O3P69_010216 [Scylla paramamosain]|uniref:Uncharacterized protein n=1 Tax=Scylla paramamosain TaxID=85552 RepID=A0AAW0TTM0_SCYPA
MASVMEDVTRETAAISYNQDTSSSFKETVPFSSAEDGGVWDTRLETAAAEGEGDGHLDIMVEEKNSSSSLTPGEVHIETATALHGYRGDEEEGPSAEGGTVCSLPPLMSYDEDGSPAPDACAVAALLSPSQLRFMASAIARSIVRIKRRMEENTDNSTGMKLKEFIKMLINTLRAGHKSQLTFVGRDICLLKSLKTPVNQSEVKMHNLALNKIKYAILYYVTNYADERYAVWIFYVVYLTSQFFVNVTRYPSNGGTEDAECIIKALLLIRKCPTKNIAMDVEQAFGANNGKRKGRASESELLSALEKCDVKLIRFLVAKLCCCPHDGRYFAAIVGIVSRAPLFYEKHRYDSGVVRENLDFANSLWKQLLSLASETDKNIKDSVDNPFVDLGVNVIGVAMNALRVFYN